LAVSGERGCALRAFAHRLIAALQHPVAISIN